MMGFAQYVVVLTACTYVGDPYVLMPTGISFTVSLRYSHQEKNTVEKAAATCTFAASDTNNTSLDNHF